MRVIAPICIVAGAFFVWHSGQQMPPVVASHFGTSGLADGSMSRDAYLALMLTVVVLVPALIALPATLLRGTALRFVDLPNRDHWLAPERREETLRTLASRSQGFACIAVAFLCVMHHDVVEANLHVPAVLGRSFFIAVAAFVAATAVWTALLIRRFATVR